MIPTTNINLVFLYHVSSQVMNFIQPHLYSGKHCHSFHPSLYRMHLACQNRKCSIYSRCSAVSVHMLYDAKNFLFANSCCGSFSFLQILVVDLFLLLICKIVVDNFSSYRQVVRVVQVGRVVKVVQLIQVVRVVRLSKVFRVVKVVLVVQVIYVIQVI